MVRTRLGKFLALETGGLGVSAVTVGELHAGMRKSGSRRTLRAIENFLAPLEVADHGLDEAGAYGEVRRALERKGTPIGPFDAQIAAHALASTSRS